MVARIIADDNKRTLSFKSDEVVFGGGRLTTSVNEIDLDYDTFLEVYEEANKSAAANLKSEEKKEEKTTTRKKAKVTDEEEIKGTSIKEAISKLTSVDGKNIEEQIQGDVLTESRNEEKAIEEPKEEKKEEGVNKLCLMS